MINPSQEPLPFEMYEIPDGAHRGWKVTVNGEEQEPVKKARFENAKMGISVEYGKRPEGYDGVVIREPGGAATAPYMIDDDGEIYMGVVTESRPTMGETQTNNIPRGFSDFKQDGTKETAAETAERELYEETGYRTLGDRVIKLASGLNPNSTFFDYSHNKDEGVSIFAVPVKREELDLVVDESTGEPYYVFPATVRARAEGDKPAEKILGSRFVPLSEALRSRDMFTSAAAGQLMAHLLDQGEYLVPQNKQKTPVDPVEIK